MRFTALWLCHTPVSKENRKKCIWCETQPAGGFILDELCPRCEVRFAEVSVDSTYAEVDGRHDGSAR